MSRLTPHALKVSRAKRRASPDEDAPSLFPSNSSSTHTSNTLLTDSADNQLVTPQKAMAILEPVILDTARRIHARYHALRPQAAQDFIAQSPSLIWSRIEHFEDWYYQEIPASVRTEATKDFFPAWCYRELNFRYLDAGRAAKREVRPASLEATGDLADSRPRADAPCPFDFVLSEADVAWLGEWNALDGVILFCLAGHWEAVPPEIRGRWMIELGLREPFPPESFVTAPPMQRRGRLAEALGVTRDVIFQRWHRITKKFL